MTALLLDDAEWVIQSFRAELAALPEASEPAFGDRVQIAPGVWTVRKVPPVEARNWKAHAVCRGRDVAEFFGQDNPERQPALPLKVLQATRAVCVTCPVRRPCLTSSLDGPEWYGVWGGVSRRQRIPVLKELEKLPADERATRIAAQVDQWMK